MSFSLSLETFEHWLKDRGIEETNTPTAQAAGVFVSEINPNAKTLIVASCCEDEPLRKNFEVMLQKLGQAVGSATSVVLTDLYSTHLQSLLSLHGELERVILLGDAWISSSERSGARVSKPNLQWIEGPGASDIFLDPQVKRSFWTSLKTALN